MTPTRAWVLAGASALLAFLALHWWHPVGSAPPFCLFRQLSNIACPGCGMTRALHALAHGDWALAVHFHPLAPLLVIEAAALWVLWGLRVRNRSARWSLSRQLWLSLLYANGAVFVALWAGRLASGTLPR